MIYDVVVFDGDDLGDFLNPNTNALRFDGLSALEAEILCKMAQEQGYTVFSYLTVVEE